MKKILWFLLIAFGTLIGCTNSSSPSADKQSNISNADNSAAFVTAKINGVAWQSIPTEILATYNDFDDKVNIYTMDEKGKMHFLITLATFSKIGVGSYSSVKEGAGGFGISLLDEDKKDNIENDYDNFHQGAVPNCITVTAITETPKGKIVQGTFASPMNVSNNYDANKN